MKKTVGKVILAKEQYDRLIQQGKTTNEIVKMGLNDDSKVIEKVELISAEELDKLLEISADRILKGEMDE